MKIQNRVRIRSVVVMNQIAEATTLGAQSGLTEIEGNMLLKRLRELWCKAMHDSVMWPVDGHYECRVCGCRYEVPWMSESEFASLTDLRVFSRDGRFAPVTRG